MCTLPFRGGGVQGREGGRHRKGNACFQRESTVDLVQSHTLAVGRAFGKSSGKRGDSGCCRMSLAEYLPDFLPKMGRKGMALHLKQENIS